MKSILITITFFVLFTSCKEKSIDTELLYGRWELVGYKQYYGDETTKEYGEKDLDFQTRYLIMDSLLIQQNRHFHYDPFSDFETPYFINYYYNLRLEKDSIFFQKYDYWKYDKQLRTVGDTSFFVVHYLDSNSLIVDCFYSMKSNTPKIQYQLMRIDSPEVTFNIDSFKNELNEFDSTLLIPIGKL